MSQAQVFRLTAFAAATFLSASLLAQTQPQNPPKAQAWIDVATFSGLGMPMGTGANPMAALGGLFGGGGAAKNTFGQTRSMAAGRWVDATLMVRANPALAEAQWAAPESFMRPALKLVAPETRERVPDESDDKPIERDFEKPRGKLLMYWGCGAAVRAGQPKVLDMASATAADLARFFVSRSSTSRGAHASAGRPLWPNTQDARMVPAGASLAGEHRFTGAGVPESFRFQIPPAQDLMPVLTLSQKVSAGATELGWNAAANARAYFVAAMGAGAGGREEMVLWTSSELPDTGFGLADYQTNASVDRWLSERVLLSPSTTQCTVPAGVFTGGGAMLRLVGYGSELNLAHPPRPSDVRQRWEPEWAVKLRVKTITSGMLGMEDMAAAPGSSPTQDKPEEAEKKPNPLGILRGILGR